ncbi:glycoside hydrolase family 26 protein [Dissulfurimicrobium hydrothermale]|uniref:glycoside hydrolase family 26 protein n=1 Tax=Dissulfurimicrobium hydrothermale TaxID=1750598 RepID=UPI001EDABF0D|nr:glycosyl hydrolase [Dissulfurimicrobium hydrothermale]UKL13281.1 glycoside hydrolase family 26 protein [Dissulfurimicrobium hydrothermale]
MMTKSAMDMKKMTIFFLIPSIFLFFMVGCRHANNDIKVKKNGPQVLIMPEKGAYTGAYVDFGDGESHVTFDALEDFEKMIGRHLAVVAFGNFWGEQTFPQRQLEIISRYGAIPLVFWSPWDRPYQESRGPDRFNLRSILKGRWDGYIDKWADAARRYGKPILVSWGLEMNGTWFPWSGYFYGGGKVVRRKGSVVLYQGPELYKKAYRYVVDRVRARGADNILWGFHVNHYGLPQAAWNRIANYYPGPEYVDWLGLSVYGKMFKWQDWASFYDVMDNAYKEICGLDPIKPVIVAEWGVGEFPPADKAGFVKEALSGFETRYTRVKAAIYWHERWQNEDGSFSNLHVNSSPEALEAYREGIASPYWIDRPKFRCKDSER